MLWREELQGGTIYCGQHFMIREVYPQHVAQGFSPARGGEAGDYRLSTNDY